MAAVHKGQGATGRFVPQTLGAPQAVGQPLESEIAVFVVTRHRFQEMFGFVGAITDDTPETHAKLTPSQQQAFLAAYFDPQQGLGYSLLRTTIYSLDSAAPVIPK